MKQPLTIGLRTTGKDADTGGGGMYYCIPKCESFSVWQRK